MRTKLLLIAAMGAILSIAFSNCGRVGTADLLTASSLGHDSCLDQLKLEYQVTYFPFLSTTCHQCHSAAHGSTDLNTSFNSFLSHSLATIDYKAITAHGGNSFSAAVNQPILDSFKPRYAAAFDAYTSCKAQSGSGASLDIRLNSKMIPSLPTPSGSDDGWVQMSWDVRTESRDFVFGQKMKSLFRVEIRQFMSQGQVLGFQIRNPRLTLVDDQAAVQISGLGIYLNEKWMDQVTTYNNLEVTVDGKVERPLAAGLSAAVIVMSPLPASPQLAFEFRGVRPPNGAGTEVPVTDIGGTGGGTNPTKVTFSQLTNAADAAGVFARNCTSCHNRNSSAGGLDLTDYNAARAAINSINSRVNDGARPMPPSGLLSDPRQRDYIGIWVEQGGPQ